MTGWNVFALVPLRGPDSTEGRNGQEGGSLQNLPPAWLCVVSKLVAM